MKILILAPEPVFSRTQGTTLRIRGVARELSRRNEVAVLAFGHGANDAPSWLADYSAVPRPSRSTSARLAALLTMRPDLADRALSGGFADTLRRRLASERFDAVLVEGLEMSPYMDVVAEASPTPLVVYDAHNAEHVLQRRAYETDRRRIAALPAALYSWIQHRRLRDLESQVCRRAGVVVCTSNADRRALGCLVDGLDALVVPNGIDAAALSPGPPLEARDERIVFVGKMDYRPNRDGARFFAREIFPRVRAERPRAQFTVVGRDPSAPVRALGRLPGVVVTGAVDDAHRYFREARVAVAPLRMGSGTRLKILEAMALGTPSVATSVAAEGLDVVRDRDLLVVDPPGDFARAVLELLRDPKRAGTLASAARRLVVERYDWRLLVSPLESRLATRA